MITAALEPPASRRIVIVEDEAILALDIERHLTRAGFDVRGVAADSEAALALVEAQRPDLVLMDIRIQGPLDGIETAKALKERFDVPVVYLTAHGDPKTMERAQRTEPMGYLLKPFKKPDLQNIVSIALARSDDERKLRRREESLRVTLSCIGEAILTIDEAGQVTYLNLAAENLMGRSNAAAIHRPLREVLPLRSEDGAPLANDLLGATRTRGRVRFEASLAAPTGPRSLVGTAAALVQGDMSFGVVLALRDLTELLQARKQLEFAVRLSSLGTLAAGVAHEVNNPLSIVISNLAFVSEEQLSASTREALTEAAEGAQRVARIVGELRSLGHPQREAVRQVEPGAVLGSALSFTRTRWRGVAGVVLELQAAPAVMAASARLAQVFVNLILNAVQAMEELSGRDHVLTLSSSTNEEGEAVLTVADTGPGVPEALRERIFEPFFTSKATGKGTGLGLAVSRSIVEHSGGRLEVGGGKGGVGTAFRVVLPGVLRSAAPTPLRTWWVGPRGPGAEALEQQAHCRVLTGQEGRLGELYAATAPEVVLLAVPDAVSSAMRQAVPQIEGRTLQVGEALPLPGTVVLRQPFEVQTLASFIRRDEKADA